MQRPQQPRSAKKNEEILPWAEEVNKHLRSLGFGSASNYSVQRKSTYRNRFCFQVKQSDDSDVIVRGGRWVKYGDGVRYDIDLTTDAGTSADPDEVITLPASVDGLNYVVLTLDDADAPTTVTASLETVYPTETDGTTLVIAKFNYSSSELKIDSKVTQLWRGGWYYDGGVGEADLARQFDVSVADGGSVDGVNIKPGMWVRNMNWNGTRRAQDYEYDAKDLAGVSSTITGPVYAYIVLQYGSGYCNAGSGTGWFPTSLAFDNDTPSGSYDTWVPSVQVEFAQGLEILFSNVQINLNGLTEGHGWDPQRQIIPLAEIHYDTGVITEIVQLHRGPISDFDPLWTTESDEGAAQFRPLIIYQSLTSITLTYSGGKWYSPHDSGNYATIAANSWTDANILEEQIYATILPLEDSVPTQSPDPSLVVQYGWIQFDSPTLSNYDADAWRTRNAHGQVLLAQIVDNSNVGTNGFPMLRAAFYHRGSINMYFERPDGIDSNLPAVDAGAKRGKSINRVAAAVSADHEGELQVYRFANDAYTLAPSFSDFAANFAVLCRDYRTADPVMQYLDLSTVKFPVTPDSIVPGDMDDTAAWLAWIDSWDHNHQAHTFNLDDHIGTAGESVPDANDGTDRYLRHNGDAARNNVSGVFGDGADKTSIAPSTRRLIKDDGTTIMLDWQLRQLKGGEWTANPDGDYRAVLGDDTNLRAGYFIYDGGDTPTVSLATDTKAGAFADANNFVDLCDGTRSVYGDGDIEIQGAVGKFLHDGKTGATADDEISGGLVVGLPVIKNIGDISPTDKVLVWPS